MVQDQRPVENRSRPFAQDVLSDQVEQLPGGLVGRERGLGLQDLAQLTMIALDGIGGIDQASPTPILTIILEDDFSSQTGWATQNEADFGFDYLDDGYTIYVKLLNAAIWSIRGPESLSDVRVETDARRYSGAVDGYYGVVCRHSDGDNYYALMISDDLSYGIANMVDGKFEFITELKDERNIIKPNDINRIAGECIGSRISLYVNGEELLSLNDTTHQTGSAGLVAKTRFTPDFQAFYEYFSLAIP